ncbi:hypothetical protein L3Y34_010173 [Caenorhabditis briggsae]|uniref:Uncharacterized protein n=1 Tax=Caenorhabditis briggsae TaxID=6238 RepID=A0AAE8ZQU5_CAEBR|nr:hypothetical protein L3Y34_010173 [Caenorhabditis briggsae]
MASLVDACSGMLRKSSSNRSIRRQSKLEVTVHRRLDARKVATAVEKVLDRQPKKNRKLLNIVLQQATDAYRLACETYSEEGRARFEKLTIVLHHNENANINFVP